MGLADERPEAMRNLTCLDCLEPEGSIEERAKAFAKGIDNLWTIDEVLAAHRAFVSEELALFEFRGTLYCSFYRASLALRTFIAEATRPLERLSNWLLRKES